MRFILLRKKNLIGVSALALILAVVLAISSYNKTSAVWLNKVERLLPIYCVETEESKVAISFDASWGAEKTPYILSTLKEYGIVATFFCVGAWAQKYSDQLKELSDSGVFEIATHSNTHPDMAKLSESKIRLELQTSIDIIEGITGTKVQLFRPPFGSYNNRLISTASSMGLHTIQWDVDSLDWKDLTKSEIASRVLSKTKKGSIILMHNDGKHTVDSLPIIIEGIKNKGLTFVKISELIYKENYTIDHTGKQIRSNNG